MNLPTDDHLDITLARGPDGPRLLGDAWRAVVAAMPRELRRPHHEPGWHSACGHHLAADPEALRYVLVSLGGEPAAVLPLVLHPPSRPGAPVTLTLFRHPHTVHADIAAAGWALPRLSLPGLLHAIRDQTDLRWDVFRSHQHLRASVVGELVRRATAEEAHRPLAPRLVLPAGQSNRMPLVPYEERLAGFSKNFRGNLRKARRKLERLESARFVTVRDPAAVEGALDDFFAVEASGWKGAAGTAIALDPDLTAFYRAVAADFAARGACELNLLYDGARPIGGQFALLAGSGYFLYKIGYDPAYGRLAPGNMLLERLLRRLPDTPGVEVVDFISDQPWHADWRPQSVPVEEAAFFSPTLPGLVAWGQRTTRRAVAPLLRRLRRHLSEARAA